MTPQQVLQRLQEVVDEIGKLPIDSSREQCIEKFITNTYLNETNQDMFETYQKVFSGVKSISKYQILLYLSVISASPTNPNSLSVLYKFYYELTNEVLKVVHKSQALTDRNQKRRLFLKLYYYALYISTDSTKLFADLPSLMKFARHDLANQKQSCMKLSRIIKIYNSILCIPEEYISIKELIQFTLIFASRSAGGAKDEEEEFHVNFLSKCERKLIKKLLRYDTCLYCQEDILSLIKILLCGNECLFAQIIHIKFSYEQEKLKGRQSHSDSNEQQGKQINFKKAAIQQSLSLRKAGQHLFNFISSLIFKMTITVKCSQIQREALGILCLKYLRNLYNNNENFFMLVVSNIMRQSNQVLTYLSLKCINEECMKHLTVNKIKMLFGCFSFREGERQLLQAAEQCQTIDKLRKIVVILTNASKKYNQSSQILYFQSWEARLIIRNARNIKSFFFVLDISQFQDGKYQVVKVTVSKSQTYTLHLSLSSQSQQFETIQNPANQRSLCIMIDSNQNEIVKQNKQYFNFGQELSYQSFIAIAIVEDKTSKNSLSIVFSIDGAYYEIAENKNANICNIQFGGFSGTFRSFYGFKTVLNMSLIYKQWIQCHKKSQILTKQMGEANIVYRLSKNGEEIIDETNNVSFFRSNAIISSQSITKVRNLTLVEIFQLLGGLQSMFFILERMNKHLYYFKEASNQTTLLLSELFALLKNIALSDDLQIFLEEIESSFDFVAQFLFLIVRRHRILNQNESPMLFITIFEFILFFRACVSRYQELQEERMSRIEKRFILEILCNCQIWAYSSYNTQVYILSELEQYIKKDSYLPFFIRSNIHQDILASIVLYQTSAEDDKNYSMIQIKLRAICYLLYEHICPLLDRKLFKGTSLEGQNISLEDIIHRDIDTCICLVTYLLKLQRKLSNSERFALILLTEYLVCNFVTKREIFGLLQQKWGKVLFLFSEFMRNRFIEQQSVQAIFNVIVSIARSANKFQKWVAIATRKLKLKDQGSHEELNRSLQEIQKEICYSPNNANDPKFLRDKQSNELEYFEKYEPVLEDIFDKILCDCNAKAKNSQRAWKNVMRKNDYWLDQQADSIGNISGKFYEIDEKQIGPYGFYKLNIRPVKNNLSELPYPRRKEYLQMASKKINQQQLKSKLNEEIEAKVKLRDRGLDFSRTSAINEAETEEKLVKSQTSSVKLPSDNPKSQKIFYCEYVTKRGVYAGVLKGKPKCIQFTFIGHENLPKQPVYQLSTGECHQIRTLSEWQQREIKQFQVPYQRSILFTRRYILRHTAFEIFNSFKHRSYFFNLFNRTLQEEFIALIKNQLEECIVDRVETFRKKQFTLRWQKGQLSNFDYLMLLNRYSGRSYNDLAQYPIMPWVIANYTGENNCRDIDREFWKQSLNFRNLELPPGKLDSTKFAKLKSRLQELEDCDQEFRFLYGTMYSNPTVLYNFFIRLEPFTSLHWQHQGKRIDHADRLFSGIAEQFNSVLVASSDTKQLTPQFYYWTQFLRNRNKIDLGKKQNTQQVDNVVLPVWAQNPEEFIFKMREVLESSQVSSQLHKWIDLVFGYKASLKNAQKYDNLYHMQCYEHDIFTAYETEAEIRRAQISISEFGQIPQQLFTGQHSERSVRKQIQIDRSCLVSKTTAQQNTPFFDFQLTSFGLFTWNDRSVSFHKTLISGNYLSYQFTKEFPSKGYFCRLIDFEHFEWVSLNEGVIRNYSKKNLLYEKNIESNCLQIISPYVIYSSMSKIIIERLSAKGLFKVGTLYGHKNQIIQIQAHLSLDLIVSVDRTGYVMVHELTDLRFMRSFQLNLDLNSKANGHILHLRLHQMGYFLFFDQRQTLAIYNFLGELFLEQDIEIKPLAVHGKEPEEQIITNLKIFSQEMSIILFSTSKGNIYSADFLQIRRFATIYPFKSYSRMNRSILGRVKHQKQNTRNKRDSKREKLIKDIMQTSISNFQVIKTSSEKISVFQIVAQYARGEIICFYQEKYMVQELTKDERLNSMGFF